jgi:DNA polymerase-3 subunit delta
MAKQTEQDNLQQMNALLANIKGGKFSPVYILMGEEPYYSDIIIEAILANVLEPSERDFNQTVVYAQDTTTADIVQACRRFPMFAPRQLVMVKEAQHLTRLDILEQYLESPSEETILVLAFTNKSVDKRTGFYKKAKASATVFESKAIAEWDVAKWITSYVQEKGYSITPDAASLMAEHTGNVLRKIVLEADKLFKGLPADKKEITVKDIETNIGISREFSAFELTKSLVFKDYANAYRIARHFGDNPKKYPLVLTLGAMFFFFSRLLKCHAYYMKDGGIMENSIRKAGIFAQGQIKEYAAAMRAFPVKKTMATIALIKEYDYKSKSGNAGGASEGDLLVELISHIIH